MSQPIVGLVLSGGGARGIAHIGAIKALQEADVHPDYISGASAGAIVGAFYAASYSCEEMLQFFKETQMFSFQNYSFRKPGLLDTDKFYKVFKKYFPEDSFEHLQKPFYLTATDIIHAKSRVFSEGPLIRAILASAAFPVVLSPMEIDGVLYSDGGIVNNFPLEPIEEQCDHLIGIYVNPIEVVSPDDISNSINVMERAYQIGVASMSLQKFDRFDLVICPENLRKYSTFSTNHIDEIYELGYQEAKKELQKFSIKSSS